METVFVLLMMMAVGLTDGLDTHCDARQDGTRCYGAGNVYLRLVEKIDQQQDYQWSKDATEVFKFKKNRFDAAEKYKDRSFFNDSSGTFKMSDITKSDEGQYVLTINDKVSGLFIEKKHLHLYVQAPVSCPAPALSFECLSQGQMMVSCSCEGDSVRYTWTLDGQTLTDQQLLPGHHDTQSITLIQGLSGRLTCDVKNNVSSDEAYMDIYPCPGFRFANCTLSNGTQIPPKWVLENDTICAVTPSTTTDQPSDTSSVGKETTVTPSTHTILTSNQTNSLPKGGPPWFIRYLPHIVGSLVALLLLLLVGVGVYCSQNNKKKQSSKQGADAEDQDVTYADVRLVQKAGSDGVGGGPGGAASSHGRVRRAEREVEYGEVKVAEREVEYGEVKVSGVRGSGRQQDEEHSVYAGVRV